MCDVHRPNKTKLDKHVNGIKLCLIFTLFGIVFFSYNLFETDVIFPSPDFMNATKAMAILGNGSNQNDVIKQYVTMDTIKGNVNVILPVTNQAFRSKAGTKREKKQTREMRILDRHLQIQNYLDIPPLPYLDNFQNPCFHVYRNDKSNVSSLRCMPNFMLGGFPKTGSTDLYKRLTQHPLILKLPNGKFISV